jgi:hypothetical protein
MFSTLWGSCLHLFINLGYLVLREPLSGESIQLLHTPPARTHTCFCRQTFDAAKSHPASSLLQLQACILGGDDFAASLGATRTADNSELAHARGMFLLTCRAMQVGTSFHVVAAGASRAAAAAAAAVLGACAGQVFVDLSGDAGGDVLRTCCGQPLLHHQQQHQHQQHSNSSSSSGGGGSRGGENCKHSDSELAVCCCMQLPLWQVS